MKFALKRILSRLTDWTRSFGLPLFFFFLPWQTRLMLNAVPLEAGATEYGILSIYATQILLLLVVLFSGRPRFSIPSKLPIAFTFAFFGTAVLSATLSIEPVVSLGQIIHLAFATLLFLTLADERTDMRRVAYGFACGLVVPVVLGVVQVIFGGSGASTILGLAARDAAQAGDAVIQTGDGVRILRAYGSFSHPNIFGGYLAVGVIVGFWLIYRGVRGRVLGLSRTPAVLLLIGLGFTLSRSAWLGLVLALLVGAIMLLIKNTRVARILSISVTLGFIVTVFALSFVAGFAVRPGSDVDFEERSVSERAEQYREYPVLVKRRAFVGTGIGTYVFDYEHVFPNRQPWEYQPVHNMFLLLIAEIGIFGAGMAILWTGSIDRVNFSRFPNIDAVAAFMMGNVIFAVMFFDHYLWSSWAGLALVAFVMGMTLRLGKR